MTLPLQAFPYVCVFCGHTYPSYVGRCGKCNKANAIRLKGQEKADANPRQRELFIEKAKPMEYRANPVERLLVGVPSVDAAFGGGIAVGSANLLSGGEGAGKSTLALRLLEICPQSMLAASEESVEQIEDRATRIGIVSSSKMRGAPLLATHRIMNALEEAAGLGVKFLIVDSLHGFDGEAEINARKIHRWCKGTGATVLAIVRLVKNNSIAGTRTIAYEFDSHIEVTCRQEKTKSGEPLPFFRRALVTRKNRFGPTGQWPLHLTERGWQEPDEGEAREED